MEHVVRPVWIALAGMAAPPDAKKVCRRSFKYIRRYFLKEVGKTFQVAELEIVQTPCPVGHFKGYRREFVPLLEELSVRAKAMGYGEYGPEWSDFDLFCCNLIALIKEELNADHDQAWVIFVPDIPRGVFLIGPSAIPIYPGGYAIMPLVLYRWPFSEEMLCHLAHELGHIFGLSHVQGVSGTLMDDGESWPKSLPDLALAQRERWILSRSPFFTEEEI